MARAIRAATSLSGRGPGASDDGTQSDAYGITSPRTHVCAPGYAMNGLHVALNDLQCSR